MDKFNSVNSYINSFPVEVRQKLQTLRKTIQEELPKAEEVISYKMPAYKVNRKYVIYFAAWKKHIAIYPFFGDLEKSIKGASAYKTSGKGTIQFPLDEDLPLPLIREITQALLKKSQKPKEKTY